MAACSNCGSERPAVLFAKGSDGLPSNVCQLCVSTGKVDDPAIFANPRVCEKHGPMVRQRRGHHRPGFRWICYKCVSPVLGNRPPSKMEWQRRNPEKRRAHKLVEYAIISGKMKRQPCSLCGEQQSHAHHEDYAKPYDVTWLCSPCHLRHHLIRRQQAASEASGRAPHQS
jgi:hypothetical protein